MIFFFKSMQELAHQANVDKETCDCRDLLVSCLMKAKHKNIVRFLGYCADTHKIIDHEVRMQDIRQRLLCFEYVPNGSLDKDCSVLSMYIKEILIKVALF
jgi:hypothetical protein